MCGIAGILATDHSDVDEATLLRMANAIAHRGPDGQGVWLRGRVGLCHRRLSIIDLEGGRQPMFNEDGSVAVVFNGEIYNHELLRADLLNKGHRFKTKSDTEVLVHLYEEFGRDLVNQLRGMFAFAIWDDKEGTLLLARDRVGLKPLYYYRDQDRIVFGSEIKAILQCSDIDREISHTALEHYLCYGVIPGSESIFARISKLAPGHTLTLTANQSIESHEQRYWNYSAKIDESLTLDDWKQRIEAKLDETIAAHQIADVPVGAFLSGGLDSSAILESHCRLYGSDVKTFSIGFDDEQFSELPYAREVAERFGCEHFEEIVTPEAATSLDILVHHYDEPFADSSAVPTLHVSKLARQHVKVVLSGDGGDEAFGGYARYAHDLVEARYRRLLPMWVRRMILANLARCWPKADWLPRPLRAKTRLTNLSMSAARAYANTISINRAPLRQQMMHPRIRQELRDHDALKFVENAFGDEQDALSGMLAADVRMLLPDAFLTKVDRASMACGLEVRPPLVDHEFLELCATIPSRFKVREGETKWVFKELYGPKLPRNVTQRPKHGFELPVDDWLRSSLRPVMEDLVLAPNSPSRDYFDQAVLRRAFDAHRSGVGRYGNALWSVLVFASWLNEYSRPSSRSLVKTTQSVSSV